MLPGLSSSVPSERCLIDVINWMGTHSYNDIRAKRGAEGRVVDDLQVILRPGLSTKGRSNQHRLFLRQQSSLFDVCLDRPAQETAMPEGKPGKDSNLTSDRFCRKAFVETSTPLYHTAICRVGVLIGIVGNTALLALGATQTCAARHTLIAGNATHSRLAVRGTTTTVKVRVARHVHCSGLYLVRRRSLARKLGTQASSSFASKRRPYHRSRS